jgi:2,4-dienoyl-CoA reductase-like NADH-dependent reductase (Old Yellow Enzyme family)
MRHPPAAIRHPVPGVRWPSEREAASSRLFSQLRSGRLFLEERTWVPAMVPWRASEDGCVTPDVLDWYARFAEGQPGALVVEATGIRDIPSGPLLRIGDDRFVPGLAALVEVVRRASLGRTRLFIQVIDFLAVRRRPEKATYFRRFFEVTDRHRTRLGNLACSDDELREYLIGLPDEELDAVLSERELEALRFGYRERVTDLDKPHVRSLPQILPRLFASAAARAERAGFDGVELHFAHAYTMAGFLSALNQREDGYGGARAARIRLPLEVYRAVRTSVGPGFVVGCRYLTEECIAGGSTLDDAAYFGVEFARAGMDFLSLSRGGKFEDAGQPKVGWAAYPYTGPSGWECMPTVLADQQGPFGRNVAAASRVRQALRDAGFETPVVVAGGIHGFDQAESILAHGHADVIASARQSLADPDWFRKMRRGRGDEVRRCVFTNYCEGLDQMHKQVTCKLWDRLHLDEPGVKLSRDGKRRLTAPAGAAGEPGAPRIGRDGTTRGEGT